MQGRVRLGKRTKELVPTLQPKEIAVISHEDLDAVGATGLIDAGVIGVINAQCSLTCRYPNQGPQLLNAHGIVLLDNVGEEIFERLTDGDVVQIKGRRVVREGETIAVGTIVTRHLIEERTRLAKANSYTELDRFITNTLTYAFREKETILADLEFPALQTDLEGKPVVVVVRGLGYRDDLQILAPFIQEARPFLIGVDGGADALLNYGYKPHLIVGDMDSVSDFALRSGAQLLAHAYPDGRCPGAKRLEKMELNYDAVRAVGTSEDIALLLAHQKGAELIILVGSHSNMVDFLEKGRPGMASTFLTRIKIGPILLDAKKFSELYRQGTPLNVVPVIIAALIPILVFITLASPWKYLLRLLWLQLRLITGWR